MHRDARSTPAGTRPRERSAPGPSRRRRVARRPPRGGHRAGDGAAHLRRPDPGGRARGRRMTDADGRRYLDAYNNVPWSVTVTHGSRGRSLGRPAPQHEHALPARRGDRARRAADRDPPGRSRHRDVRQLRLRGERRRMAPCDDFTGNRGALCTAFAYHGSPRRPPRCRRSPGRRAAARPCRDVGTARPYRGRTSTRTPSPTLVALAARGHAPAATILDGVLTSDGISDLDPARADGRPHA